MEIGLSNTLLAGDPRLVDHIVGEVKSQGIFDQFRKECIADVDTKPAYQNLHTRVEGSVNSFLDKQSWKPDLNKNQLRETLRKHIHEAPYLDTGVERIVDQVVNPKVYSVFMPQIEDVVYKFLGLEKPKAKEKIIACGFKDLLPKDLDPVSPESDKNSLKDVSLESVDTIDDLDIKRNERSNELGQHIEIYTNTNKDDNLDNEQISYDERIVDESCKLINKSSNNLNITTSTKSDDKTEEDEEDSPTFEPIDIMNLNESNISNDSHLSGISELTSHRSRSPDFSNEISRDNFDYSNQDSQLSKVSSDSRLSIVTDFGSSNHAVTPIHDTLKDDMSKERFENKYNKDNFRAIRELESCKTKSAKSMFELHKCKDVVYDTKDTKDVKTIKSNSSSKENSRDALDSGSKEKYDHKKEKHKENESSKSKSVKEKFHSKDSKYYKDKDNTDKKKHSSHSNTKCDKHSKHKSREKTDQITKDQIKEITERTKDVSENSKESKHKEERTKEIDRKENSNKEVKDLKDLYKEKIRELREKKELTEKERLNKDTKEVKINKESKDRKDTKERKLYKKEHKSTSSKNISHHESKPNKPSEKISDPKERKSESRDKGKRDDRHMSKSSSKDGRSRNHFVLKTEGPDKYDKQDLRKSSKSDKDDKYEKSEMKKEKNNSEKTVNKKDGKNHLHNKSADHSSKPDGRQDVRSDTSSKDKKRRDDKKSKTKDDHSSLRKNSNDRRSTDRDGSNGSNSKSSQSSNSSSSITTSKSSTSSLNKETSHVNNSSSETSDSIEETQVNELKTSLNCKQVDKVNIRDFLKEHTSTQSEVNNSMGAYSIAVDSSLNENNLPLKKRPLLGEDGMSTDIKIKKPKFAKNIHEAKKLMKIRKRIEKEKIKENKKIEKKVQQKPVSPTLSNTVNDTNDLERVPDEERVQIIEIPDEEYEEPYPEKQTNLTLEEHSIILLGEPCTNNVLETQFTLKSKLSNIELSIGHSINETIHKHSLVEIAKVTELVGCNQLTEENLIQHEQQSELSPSNAHKNSIKNNKVNREEADKTPLLGAETIENQDMGSSCNATKFVSRTLHSSTNDISNQMSGKIHETIGISDIKCKMAESTKTDSDLQVPHLKTCNSETSYNKSTISSITHKHIAGGSTGCVTFQSSSMVTEDYMDCRYFTLDNEKFEKFSQFVEAFELEENSTLEDIIESLGGQVVSSMPKEMAPPQPKRKHSSSPLTDILFSNSNNNNDGHKNTVSLGGENALNNIKKRKLVGTKKTRFHASLCAPQGLSNGENFVMPLSPESDVSATSEKTPSSNTMKEEKSRHRSSQRYSSDDLYKPRPLFSSSSRRSRRSNQA